MQREPSAHDVVPETMADEAVEADPPITTGYRIANQVAAAVCAFLGAGLAWSGIGLGLVAPNGTPGPGVFPVAIGVLFVVLAIMWFALAAAGRLDRSTDTQLPDRAGLRRILVTAIATAVFLWALPWIGYLLAMTLYVLALLVFVGERRWLSSLIIAVVFGAGSYVAFTVGLHLSLPRSVLPLLAPLGI